MNVVSLYHWLQFWSEVSRLRICIVSIHFSLSLRLSSSSSSYLEWLSSLPCSHLELILNLRIIQRSCRTSWTWGPAYCKAVTYTGQDRHIKTHTDIHASNWIRPTIPVFEPSCRYNASLQGKLNTASFKKNITYVWSRDSVVGIATGYVLDCGVGVRVPLGWRLLSKSSRRALQSTQPPIQWVPGSLSAVVKRPGREADHSPPASSEVKKMWIYISNLPIRLYGVVLNLLNTGTTLLSYL
jgi:hypothetical protein